MNVVVTGSRDWPRDELVPIVNILDGLYLDATLGHLTTELSEFHLYAGENPRGVDAIAKEWAEVSPTHSHNEHEDDPLFAYHGFPADWNQWGKSAGPIRNLEMLAAAGSGFVLAFHASPDHYLDLNRKREGKKGSSGTNHCAWHAKQRGFRVYHVIRDSK